MSEINFDPVTLTQSLVKCASVTPKDEGALTVVENHLSAIGCDCHPLTFSGNNSYEVKNLFATIGNEGKHFAYAGHTDVVPVGNENSWKYPPFSAKIDEGKLYGRGSEDMKSSVACFISAAKRFVDKYKNIHECYVSDFETKWLNTAKNNNIKVITGGIDQLIKQKNTYDLIIMNHVVEHWNEFSYEINNLNMKKLIYQNLNIYPEFKYPDCK